MASKVNQSVKYHIISTLQNEIFSSINKARKGFILSVLWRIFSIKNEIKSPNQIDLNLPEVPIHTKSLPLSLHGKK